MQDCDRDRNSKIEKHVILLFFFSRHKEEDIWVKKIEERIILPNPFWTMSEREREKDSFNEKLWDCERHKEKETIWMTKKEQEG